MKRFISYALHAIFIFNIFTINETIAKNSADQSPCDIKANATCITELPIEIQKSPTDKATYQAIKLDNGMEVLLISDEKANKSLMSIGLPIGSMDDPITQQGLAHYLEHMILMGSKKYPETNSLDAFLTKNGGYNNAYTSADRTIYFLEVNHSAFNEAVDRLSDSLAQPLLAEKNAKKEINAVNAEMVRAKSSDQRLMYDVQLATSNPDHPVTKFSVGNNISLSDKENSQLQAELESFYQKYYSANIMKAVLYSNQSIDSLMILAKNTLGNIKNKSISLPKIEIPLLREEDKSILIHYKSIKPFKRLSIQFDMPADKSQFKEKTGEYLAYLFSNNTENTLSDYLIKQGLSDSGIEAYYTPEFGKNRSSFDFYITLTKKGFNEKDKIISLIFQQIEKVKNEGIQESYFAEIKTSLQQEFQHLQIEKNGDYISNLTSQMIDYPLAYIIDQPYIVEKMNKRAILDKLAEMNIDNARIFIVSDQIETDQKTRYFEAPYKKSNITAEQKEKWLNFSQNPVIQLPSLNPYFSTDFNLNKNPRERLYPIRIAVDKGLEIFAMNSRYFSEDPNVHLQLDIEISPPDDELKSIVSATLLNYMNQLAQNKLFYQGNIAGISTSMNISQYHLSFNIEGYTQNIEHYLKDLATQFSQFTLTEDLLKQSKKRYFEALDHADKENALIQANQAFNYFTHYPYFSNKKEREMIANIELKDIQRIRENLLKHATSMRLLSVGNLSDKQLNQVITELSTIIRNNNSKIDYGKYIDISQSQRKLTYIKQIPHQDNAFVAHYFTRNYEEIDGISHAMLLVDILYRWYFDDLRTDKQLGYIVGVSRSYLGKTVGLKFTVQSPTASPQTIEKHNQRFFKEALAKLKAMPKTEFDQYKQSLIDILHHKPESLSEEFEQFFTEFTVGKNMFNDKAKVIERLKTLTQEELITFYKQSVINQEGFVFISQAIGTQKAISQPADLPNFEKISNIEALQKEFKRKRY